MSSLKRTVLDRSQKMRFDDETLDLYQRGLTLKRKVDEFHHLETELDRRLGRWPARAGLFNDLDGDEPMMVGPPGDHWREAWRLRRALEEALVARRRKDHSPSTAA
jgi:hypothetical protein